MKIFWYHLSNLVCGTLGGVFRDRRENGASYTYITSPDNSERLMTALAPETINGACWVSAAAPHIQEY